MSIQALDGNMLKNMFINGYNTLNRYRNEVDSLNVYPVPDGDTGTNMSLTLSSAISELNKLKDPTAQSVAKHVSRGCLMGARGNSGVILSQIFRGFDKGCKGKDELSVNDFVKALEYASETAYKAVMHPVEGTILTIVRSASEKAKAIDDKNLDFESFLKLVISHCEDVLDKTPDMLDVLKQAGVVDAGGKGFLYVLKGFLEVVSGKEIVHDTVEPTMSKKADMSHIDSDITFGYCTEFIIKNGNIDPDAFKDKIVDKGDSMLVVGDEEFIKVHIHTNNPGSVLEKALLVGELIDIKIDNMRHQHDNKHISAEMHNELDNSKEPEVIENKKYGIIAVSIGEGLNTIFNDMHVNKIIEGGQTMNPSTEDILKAVDELNADNIFVLPNNSNIILAAKQAAELSEKNVIVIPSKTICQGISSLINFDESQEFEDNFNSMSEAIKDVKSIQVTYSVRDSSFNDLEINKDDILGICDGDIVKVGKAVPEVAADVIDDVFDEDEHEIITVYYGKDISEDKANEFVDAISEKYPDIDVECYSGGQPLYYYLIAVE